MKKQFLLVLLIAFSTVGVAQTVNLHMKNGETVKYNSSDIDFLDFSEDGQQTSSDKYGISGGVRVNYGKKIHNITNYLDAEKYDVSYDSFGRLSRIEASGTSYMICDFDYNKKTITIDYKYFQETCYFDINEEGCISKLVKPLVDSLNNVMGYYGYEYEYTDVYLTKVKRFNNTGVNDHRVHPVNTSYFPDSFVYNGGNLFKMTYHHNFWDYVERVATDSTYNKGNFYVPLTSWSQQITFMSVERYFSPSDSGACHYCIDTILFNSGMFGKVSKYMVTTITRTQLPEEYNRGSYNINYSYDLEGYVNSIYCKGSIDLDVIYK